MSVFDLLMRLAEIGVHDLLWSEDLLAELAAVWDRERTAGRRVPSAPAAAAALAGVRRTFPHGEVVRDLYVAAVDEMPGTDPGDRVHVAAAVAGGATHLVTDDLAGGFPVEDIAALGVTVETADGYLGDVAREYPGDVRTVVAAMVARRRRHEPSLTVVELVERWRAIGLEGLAAALGTDGE